MLLMQLFLLFLIICAALAIVRVYVLYNEESLYISPIRITVAVFLPIFISWRARKKKSLDYSGAVAALFVGFIITMHGFNHMCAMIAFFVSSSALTKFRKAKKIKFEAVYKEGGQRNWEQVYANGGVATMFALFAIMRLTKKVLGEERVLWLHKLDGGLDRDVWYDLAMFGSLASAAGDTWASEIGGAVGEGDPFLITTFRRVPRGTNGGVSVAGIISSAAGGAFVGLVYWVATGIFAQEIALPNSTAIQSVPQSIFVLIGAICGLYGSIIDSVLGATLQYSGFNSISNCIVEEPGKDVSHISGMAFLNNNSVNFLCCLLTAVSAPSIAQLVCKTLFFSRPLFL